MSQMTESIEAYRMARLKVALDQPGVEVRVRLVAEDDPALTIESAPLVPDTAGEADFTIDTGQLEARTWRAVLVKTPTPEALAILDATDKAQRGEAALPEVTAEQARSAGLPLETPLGTVRTRDPLEQVFAVVPERAIEHVRAYGAAKGWSDIERENFLAQLREMGLATWRDALGKELTERQAMIAMLDTIDTAR